MTEKQPLVSGDPSAPPPYPEQPPAYAPQPAVYPPQPAAYPPQHAAYPPQHAAYPPQAPGYGGYPPTGAPGYQPAPPGPYQGCYSAPPPPPPPGGCCGAPGTYQAGPQTIPVTRGQAIPHASRVFVEMKPPNYVAMSIIVMLFFNFIFGLLALLHALQVDRAWEAGDRVRARFHSYRARRLNIIGMTISLVIAVVVIIIVVVNVYTTA